VEGGGLYVTGNYSIEDSTFLHNTATDNGGGIYSHDSSGDEGTITHSVFDGNYAEGYSAALCIDGGSLTLFNDLFVLNESGDYGGAVGNWTSAETKIENCTIADNMAATEGGGVNTGDSSTTTIKDSIIYNNSAPSDAQIHECGTCTVSVTYSAVKGGYTGTGNTSDMPMFETGGYHLPQGIEDSDPASPCINSGSDSASSIGLDGKTTAVDGDNDSGTVDMGYHHP